MTERPLEQPITKTLDTSGLQCPMPLLKTRQALRHLPSGALLAVIASDPGSARDIPAFLRQSCHELVRHQADENVYTFVIRRGQEER